MTIASTVNFVLFDRRRRWSPVYHTEEGISRCTTKVNSIRPSAFTELRHEPVHLLVDQPKRHRFVAPAHQRLHSTQMNPCDALPHAHSTGHVGERPVTSVTICHTCSRSRGSYISRLLERLSRTPQTTVAFCRTWVVTHCGPTPIRYNTRCYFNVRSKADNNMRKLFVPRTHNKLGDRSCSAAGPRLWNDLPPGLRRPGLTFDSFRQFLKTHLFGDRSAW